MEKKIRKKLNWFEINKLENMAQTKETNDLSELVDERNTTHNTQSLVTI